jgi:putative membrane protein
MYGLGNMGGLGYGSGFGFGGILMLIFWGLIIWAIVALVRFANNGVLNNQRNQKKFDQSPIDIAKKRFASGEITKEEFEEIKKNL